MPSEARLLARYRDGALIREVTGIEHHDHLEVRDSCAGEGVLVARIPLITLPPLNARAQTRPRGRGSALSRATRAERGRTRPAPRAQTTKESPMHTAKPTLSANRVLKTLGAYRDPQGTRRTLLMVRSGKGSTLVIDRRDGPDSDMRLVGHLASDESIDAAHTLAKLYRDDPTHGRCRALQLEDLYTTPYERPQPIDTDAELADAGGKRYRLAKVSDRGNSADAAAWSWVTIGPHGRYAPVTLRDVIGAVEEYDPARRMTVALLARDEPGTSKLRDELRRLDHGNRVLVRGLRERAVAAVERGDVTWTTLAQRVQSTTSARAETTYVQRRLGLRPEQPGGLCARWMNHDTFMRFAAALGVDPYVVGV
ncbi:MAG: hypothetical protein ACYDA6_10565 [Solirubrobacteraceae bacterium]